MKQQNQLFKSALQYASHGCPVFPLHTPTNNSGCSCRNPKCKDQGKHPRTKNGLKDATTDKVQIGQWWTKWPDANIGLITGHTSGFFALDVDIDKETGEKIGEEELKKHPSLPETIEFITGSGGRQFLFVSHKNKRIGNKVKFLPGLDIRGEGGYIVAPPSLHESGQRYKWKNGNISTKDSLADCPDWILDAIEHYKKTKSKTHTSNNGESIPEGERNDTLFRYACRLRDKGLTKEEIITLVTSRNKEKCEIPLDETEVMLLIESALSYGTDDSTRLKLDEVLPDMILPFNDFKKLDLPERKMLLYPWIQESDLILMSGDAGVGKTRLSMEICSAIQNGRDAMNDLWTVENPVKCLYCDGESLWDDIQNMGSFTGLGNTHILSKTYLEYNDVVPSLNLSEPNVRDLLYDYIIKHEFKFVVLDNLFSLWAGIDLDNAKEWNESNQWLLKLRSKGVCVVLIHHTNKQGGQMGTASKLFNLNTALILKKTLPQQKNNNGEEIASFGIKVEKQRAKGTGLEDYTFTCDDGVWSYTKKKKITGLNEDSKAFYIVLLLLDNKIQNQAEISKLVRCNPTYVSQVKKYTKYKNFFYGDGSSTSDGIEFLKKNRDPLTSFYNQKGLDVK
jgi:hypothetical protein